METQGKVAVITGSSRGVGRAVALRLARQGCRIVLNFRSSKEEAESVLKELQKIDTPSLMIQADVSKESDCLALIQQTVDRFGGVDILVNNAATTDFLPFADLSLLTDAHWDRVLQTNVKGPFYCSRAAEPWLKKSKNGGEIINITSVAGLIGNGSSMAYCASKAALINMTVSLARVLAPQVRVNAVAPGFIADDWTQQGLKECYEDTKEGHESKAVLGKVCHPDDVAAAVVSLITGSDLITGQNLVCDGGAMIGPSA
ncbi:MAG: SDR family oxidoreductase [Verrucomicrobia bacterium]|jgi:3-oxoacyl-[acyl-carrier protein] reductase|nr:SDR family oxidoreductase [Verrucomicrobiota bacterium]MBT5478807.1 SDR family oxidoreductase [Verrucomicrobiota bacterium]MBT7537605.1 SDR family oxidoreductase [Verrucomicrobiota bacterium]